jgi:DNA-binding transcriptional MerR regulator
MTRRLLAIGRFAQLTGLTIKALRLYDEPGLLTPDTIDEGSRYRYYASTQFPRAEMIARLRRIDMPLGEIGRYLAADSTVRDAIMSDHRNRLAERVDAATLALKLTEELTMSAPPNVTSMELKRCPEQPVMRILWTLPENPVEENPLAPMYKEIRAVAERQGLTVVGAPYCICYSDNSEDGMVRGEAGIPVAEAGVAEGRVEPAVLPGGDVASTHYTGPNSSSADGAAVTRELWSQIEAARLVAHGDPRWIYETPPEDQVTELVWSVTPDDHGLADTCPFR